MSDSGITAWTIILATMFSSPEKQTYVEHLDKTELICMNIIFMVYYVTLRNNKSKKKRGCRII